MSRDQKPKAVKAVTVAGGGTQPDSVDSAHGAQLEQGAEGHASPKAAMALFPALLFLFGCVIGGAALTALTHYKPEVAALLYGTKP